MIEIVLIMKCIYNIKTLEVNTFIKEIFNFIIFYN